MTLASTSASSTLSERRAMSGHSKWSSIKHKKGAADAKRGKLFSKLARAIIDADRTDEDSVMLAAAEGGADDVTQDGDSFEVTTSPEALSSVREALEQAGIEVESAETTMVPKTTIELDQEAAARKTLRLIDELEELDDVSEVYANFDIPERLLEAVAS